MHSHSLVESAHQNLGALQAQVEELEADVYESMCALGVESNRVAALVDALVSIGVDPSSILNSVENEHLATVGTVDMEAESNICHAQF